MHSILHRLSLLMLTYIYNNFKQLEYIHPSHASIRDLLFFILQNNVSDFNGEKFIQNVGIGQGVDFAAQVCDFVMIIFDLLLQNKEWVKQVCTLQMIYSGRYRDDYLIIAAGDLDDVYLLREGLNHLLDFNPMHETPITAIFDAYNFNLGDNRTDVSNIQFTTDIDTFCPLSIQILEVRVMYDMILRRLVTKMSSKKTDPHAYLDTHSCHPGTTFTGTIKGVALRIRSTTDDCFLQAETYKYKCYLIARGYDPLLTNTIFNMYSSLTKEEALRRWNPMDTDILKVKRSLKNARPKQLSPDTDISQIPDFIPCARFIHKYHPLLVGLFRSILKRNWEKYIAGDAILFALFPLSYFKETWQRAGLNMKERLTPNRFADSNHKLALSQQLTHSSRVQISLIDHYIFDCKRFIWDLRINDESHILIDHKLCKRDLLEEWRGFVPCKTLKQHGIVKNVTTKCLCNHSNHYIARKRWKCRNTNETFKISQKLSCFSRNIIYIITCDRCGDFYVGKCGAGINGNRCLRDHHSEHSRNIKNVYEDLVMQSFYDNDGVIQQTNSLILKGIIQTILKHNYTREILHFTGLDGTKCYRYNGGDPLKFYLIFAFRQYHELTRSQCNDLNI